MCISVSLVNKLVKKSVSASFVITLFAAIGLTGCGGADDSKTDSTNVLPVVFAPDVFELSPITDLFFVDVIRQGRVSDGSAVKLTNVSVLTEDPACYPTSQSEEGFFVSADFAKVCDYRYTLASKTNPAASASGISRVGISDSNLPTVNLPPLAVAVNTDVPLTIDIRALLIAAGSNVPSGYELDDYIMVLGSGIAAKGQSPNTILYTPLPGWHGVARLLYSYRDSLDSDQLKLGSIAVAVSAENNIAPTANNFTYPEPVALGNTVTIDVAPYISDADMDVLQLIDVFSWNGELAIPQVAGDFSGSKFTFRPTSNDSNYITYVVSDHKGGYGVGMIKINVGGPYSDIPVGEDLVFSGPLTIAQALYSGISFATVNVGNGTTALTGVQSPVYTYAMAEAYCTATGARLPDVAEMQRLFQQEGSVYSGENKQRWPAGVVYWTSSVNSYGRETINLHTGIKSPIFSPLNAHHFVTCVDPVPVGLMIVGVPTYADYGQKILLKVHAVYENNIIFPFNKPITWSSSDTSKLTISQSGEMEVVQVSLPNAVRIIATAANGLTATVDTRLLIIPKVCGNTQGHPLDTSFDGGINNTSRSNISGNCLKIAEAETEGRKKWFTSSPSLAVMDALGYISYPSHDSPSVGDHYNYLSNINEYDAMGSFPVFNQYGYGVSVPGSENGMEGVNGQYDRWCKKLALLNFAGKSDWRRATHTELVALYRFAGVSGSMSQRYGWPTMEHYSTSTAYTWEPLYGNWAGISMVTGLTSYLNVYDAYYASCVSEVN